MTVLRVLRTLLIALSPLLLTSCLFDAFTSGGTQGAVMDIRADRDRALVGETFKIYWASSGTSSCTLGGDLTGGVAPAGQMEVRRAVAGTFEVTLSCVGGGAAARMSMPIIAATTYSVSTTAPVAYPSGYLASTTTARDINNDPCKFNLDVVIYPQSWIGRQSLPPISGAPLHPDIGRGVVIKDIMLDNNPGFVLNGSPDAPNGCNNGGGALKSALAKTAQRIAGLGAGYVKITQWHWITIKPDGSFSIKKAEDSFGPISDDNLRSFVEAAHAQGLKVVIWNQIQAFVDDRDNIIPTPEASSINYNKFFDAFDSFATERSSFFQKINVDIWEMGCQYCVYYEIQNKNTQESEIFYRKTVDIIRKIKNIYKGRTYIGDYPWINKGNEIIDMIDYIETSTFGINRTISEIETDHIGVSDYKSAIGTWVSDLNRRYNKPILFNFGIQSRRNALSNPGYLEETACTSSINTLQLSQTDCLQRKTEVSLALQAVAYEATFEYISGLGINSMIVFVNDYLVADSLYPQTAFPNIAFSFRNKPAEGVVRAWFAK